VAIAGVTNAIVAMTNKAGESASAFFTIATALDTTTDKLQEYRHIAQQSGVSTDAFEKATERLVMRLKGFDGDGSLAITRIEQLGIALKTTSGDMRSLGDISDDVIVQLSKIKDVSQRNVIASELFGRQWVDISNILDQGVIGIETLRKEAHELGVVLGEDSLKTSLNFYLSLEQLKSQFSKLKDEVAGAFAPVLKDTFIPLIRDNILPLIKGFAERIKNLTKWFNGLSPETKKVVTVITALSIAIAPLSLALGGILKLVPLIISGFKIMGGAMGALLSPIGLITTATATAVALGIKYWDELKLGVLNAIKFIVDKLSIYYAILGKIERVRSLSSFAETLRASIKSLEQQITDSKKPTNEFADALAELETQFDDLKLSTDNAGESVTGFLNTLNAQVKKLREQRDSLDFKGDIFVLNDRIEKLEKEAYWYSMTTEELKKYKQEHLGLSEIKIDAKIGLPQDAFDKLKQLGDIQQQANDAWLVQVEKAEDIANRFKDTIVNVIGNSIEHLTDIIAGTSTLNFGQMVSALLMPLADMAITAGTIILTTGEAIEALKDALISFGFSGPGAIFAGAALVGVGIAAKAGLKALAASPRSQSYAGTSESYAPAGSISTPEFQGAYKGEVVFKIGQNELVGILEMANNQRMRL
jgi:hypothetical protein